MSTQTILLLPRPFARFAGKLLLVPLLPLQKPQKSLPVEVWNEILAHALVGESASWCWSVLTVCKDFKDIGLPLLYSKIQFSQLSALEKLHSRLHHAEQGWDSIRRIPYSAPGRWVQYLDLSRLALISQLQALLFDSVLTNIFPLIPFLSCLYINPSFVLSRRALYALCERDGASNLKALGGLTYLSPPSVHPEDDPFVRLLRCCPNLEEFEIVGQGLDPVELEFGFQIVESPSMDLFQPLYLPKLLFLSLLSMPTSPLMLALLYSPLPALQKLTITPYDDISFPSSLASSFIAAHGEPLRSLLLITPKSWPTRLRPSPDNLLMVAPRLRHLSLENPLPDLSLTDTHNLQILSIPRPNSEYWPVFERTLRYLPRFAVLRTRDVRWLRKGMTSMAQDTGVQGEMKEWKRRLARRRIRLLDADWREDSGA